MSVALNHLKTRKDFLRVAAAQRKWVTPGLILQAAPVSTVVPCGPVTSPESPSSVRVGFTVSKKVGNAVHRNRARRRLRAAVAEIMGDLAFPDYDYVIIGRVQTLDRPYQMLLNDLRTALLRIITVSPGSRPPFPRKRQGVSPSGPNRSPEGRHP